MMEQMLEQMLSGGSIFSRWLADLTRLGLPVGKMCHLKHNIFL
jgi:hypothetical protein